MVPQLLGEDTLTETMEIICTLHKVVPGTFLESILQRSIAVPRNKDLWRLVDIKPDMWHFHC
jgi:hypothetical protein